VSVTLAPPLASGALPRVGHLLAWSRDPLGLLSRVRAEHGDVVGLSFRGARSVLLCHPDDIARVHAETGRGFQKAQGGYVFPRAFGNGLLTSSGEFWRRQRALAQPAFHRRRIAGYAGTMVRLAQEMADSWGDGQTLDVHAEMSRLTQRIAGVTLFGLDTETWSGRASAALGAINRAVNKEGASLFVERLPASVPTRNRRRADAAIAELDGLVADLLAARSARPGQHDDLLAMLAEARDADGQGMSPRQLRDEVVTLYLAGHETTANTLSWVWHLLGRHEPVARRLADELTGVLGDRAAKAEDVAALPFTRAVIDEAMRLYPPIWQVFRIAVEDAEFRGYTVPAGTGVMMSQWLTQRDLRWFDHPDRFDPDRWLDGRTRDVPRYAYFPFGGGPRVCLGSAFAVMEAVLVVATVARRVSLRPLDAEVRLAPLITLRPDRGIRVRVQGVAGATGGPRA
jgi:cytochrome P450